MTTTGLRAAGVALAAAVLLAACTSGGATGPTPTSSPSSSPSSPTTSASRTTSASPSGTPSSSPAPVDAVTIDITIAGDRVRPNAERIDVRRGQTVVLNVTSDIDDEIHAHTAGDGFELEVSAGKPVTGRFVATDTGSFEVESHHLEKVIAVLVVR